MTKPSGYRRRGKGSKRKTYPLMPRKTSRGSRPVKIPKSYTKTTNKKQIKSLDQLKKEQDVAWISAKRIEQEWMHNPERRKQLLDQHWNSYYATKPDLRPIVYHTSIGHYGGLYVKIPEEHYSTFKSHFPSREFPRDVRTTDVREEYTFEGEQNFRKRFPSSNKIKTVFFSDRSKGTKRLEYMRLPVPE